MAKCLFVVDKNTIIPFKSEIIIKFTRSTINVILYANTSKLSNIKSNKLSLMSCNIKKKKHLLMIYLFIGIDLLWLRVLFFKFVCNMKFFFVNV